MPRALVALLVLLAVPVAASALTLRTRLRPPRHGLQVRLGRITVPAAHEREVCQLVTLPNRRAMDVRDITIAMPSGLTYTSHHFAIFVFEGDRADVSSEPFDNVGCTGIGNQFVSPILAFVQRPKQRIVFPKGVGVRLRRHERVLLNAHYLNGGPEPVTIDVAANFRAAPRGSIRHHARSFQLGTLRIGVPPASTGHATASWITRFPMNVVRLSTHSHKHTTSVDVDVLRQRVDAGQELRTLSYAEPTVRTYETTPLRLEAGDGFRWTCNYRNDTANELTFGVTSNDEMCFTVGYFYPDDDRAPLPRVPGCFGAGDGLVCPFN